MSQLLTGMISEPAFLSEYTVFALEPTKRPKSKSECVVSPHCSILHSDCLEMQEDTIILEAKNNPAFCLHF